MSLLMRVYIEVITLDYLGLNVIMDCSISLLHQLPLIQVMRILFLQGLLQRFIRLIQIITILVCMKVKDCIRLLMVEKIGFVVIQV
ncbi:MAG: hypothetical protein CMI31_09435 [Opitutae bacterium]|nr:hypothetical protein [Opitutae bacterium]